MKTRWNNCFRSLPLVSPLCPPLFSVLFPSLLFSFLPSPSYPYSHCQNTLPPSNVSPLSPSYITIQSSYTILPFSFMLDVLMSRSHNISTPHRPALLLPISVHSTPFSSTPLLSSPLLSFHPFFSSPPLVSNFSSPPLPSPPCSLPVVIMRHDASGLMETSPVINPTSASPNLSRKSRYFWLLRNRKWPRWEIGWRWRWRLRRIPLLEI